MTLILLGLDALDAALVEYFDVDAFRLEHHTRMETFANMREVPYTPEVWASVATGLEPDDHGVTDEGTSEWANPLAAFASRFTGHLPLETRAKLGDVAERFLGEEYRIGRTDEPTFFDGPGRVVHTWPGAGPSGDLVRLWKLMSPKDGNPRARFDRVIFGLGAQQVAWAREMTDHDLQLAGVHVHTLDICGHAYATEEDTYRDIYEKVGGWVAEVRDALGDDDELLVVSDHGMNAPYCKEEGGQIANHSFRAFASTTVDDDPPETVFEVRDWVEAHVEEFVEDESEVDLPTETLRDLGYVE